LWRYRRCVSHTFARIQRCGLPQSIPSSGSSTTAQQTSAVLSQLLKSPHSKRPVLRVYPCFPVDIQLLRSLETWRISYQAVLISRSRYHHRLPRRTYGGDVSSLVGLVRITLFASVVREERSLSGGTGRRVGRIMNRERELVARTVIRPSIPDRGHRHRWRVNPNFCHIHRRH
jgi:hypothetical protein